MLMGPECILHKLTCRNFKVINLPKNPIKQNKYKNLPTQKSIFLDSSFFIKFIPYKFSLSSCKCP